ncbi:MAG TPA: aminotransferase class I/II-fold pyridoxal phosphate-dependent enzyme [Candidatus Thermoplasmatota archaeon]|nr:aminotransferase class I/II-fold pyridoxal phosphate-dependent enzyme [Candidatus Thermoplasmatota archaeon]
MPARRMDGIDMSGIRKLFELAGKDAIHLGIGEPDFQPPSHVVDAYVAALRAGHNKYCPSAGIPELRAAIAQKVRPHLPSATAEHVVVSTGSTTLLYGIAQAFLDPGDEALVPDPGFVLYAPHARLAGATAVPYPLTAKQGFLPDPGDLENRIGPRTRMLVLNSPSNPTGAAITRSRLEEVLAIAERHDLLVVSDEAYEDFVYDGPHETALGRYDKLVYLNTFSKCYAMTGWRLGYAVAPPEIAVPLKRVNYHLIASPPTPAQHAALAALQGPQDFVRGAVEEYRRRRDYMVGRLDALPRVACVKPTGAFYAFPRVDVPIDDEQFALELLKAGVVTSPGRAFGAGGRGHLRLSYATAMDKLRAGLDIVERVIRSL